MLLLCRVLGGLMGWAAGRKRVTGGQAKLAGGQTEEWVVVH
jgi:hypothetical protein